MTRVQLQLDPGHQMCTAAGTGRTELELHASISWNHAALYVCTNIRT